MRVRREKKNFKNSADILPYVRQNLRQLDDEQWYGDSIIEFCLTMACEVALSEGHSLTSQWNLGKAGNDFSVLSSFLIPRVISSKNGMKLPSATGWIRGGNHRLCESEFLLFPMNFENSHWSLGIVWLAPLAAPGSIQWKRCILYLDSLSLSSSTDRNLISKFRKKVEAKCVAIRTYLNMLSQDVNTSHNLPVIHVKVPQQTNDYDCGLMVLHYAILFITCANKRTLAIDLIDGKKENWYGVPHDKVSWYILQLRNSVREAVLKLLKLLPTDESKTTVGRTSKTTVGRTTSDGIVDLLSEEDERDEKEGSLSRRQLEGKLRGDMAQQQDGNSK